MKLVAAVALLAAFAASSAAAATPTVTEFPIPTANAAVQDIALGPDGNMWFTEFATDKIGRITPTGVVTEFSTGMTAGAKPYSIAAGPDGNMWFTEFGKDKIGRITPAGVITETNAPVGSTPKGIAAGPNGVMWFTAPGTNSIARFNPATPGTVTNDGGGISPSAEPTSITSGPDFAMWFGENIAKLGRHGVMNVGSSEVSAGAASGVASGPGGRIWYANFNGNQVGYFTPSGGAGTVGVTTGSAPREITPGPDGNMWFTETNGNRIGRVSSSGTTEFSDGITPAAAPFGIAAGADGAMWFTEFGKDKIGRITTAQDPMAFTASTPIVLPTNLSGPAAPYPAPIEVAGLQGTVTNVRVRLNGLFAPRSDALNALLVSPEGQSVLLLSHADSLGATGAVLSFADDGITPGQLVSGLYTPLRGFSDPTFAAPAPAGPYTTSLSNVNGTNPNGTWSLYVSFDGFSANPGVIAGGWSLDLRTTGPPAVEPPDTTPPGVSVNGVPKTMPLKKFVKGFDTELAPDEPASFDVTLTGTSKKAKLFSTRLILFDATLPNEDGNRTITVKPAKKAIGKPKKPFKVRLDVTGIDRGGNRTDVEKTIKISPRKKKKGK